MKIAIRLAIICILASIVGLSQTKNTDGNNRQATLEKMPESLESRYAVSALPPRLRDAATIYLLIRPKDMF